MIQTTNKTRRRRASCLPSICSLGLHILAIGASGPLALAQTPRVDPTGRSILFVRGADGSGGATEGGTTAQRTEQLSDITNTSTANGNHGWASLRTALLADGFSVAQRIESSATWSLNTLLPHRVVVMGSNNKTYSAAEVKVFHDYIDAGGSALFISDANWGLTWEAAPASDNSFLARYGAQVYQDSGGLPTMARSTSGRYLIANHPVLSGPDGVGTANTTAAEDDVQSYNGEGVNLFRITQGSDGYQAVRLVSASGLTVRLNTTDGKAGATASATTNDAAMILVENGTSRILGHFDRNTFFNVNGAGTDLTKLDNLRLARNVFRFLASIPASVTTAGKACGNNGGPTLSGSAPILGTKVDYILSQGAAGRSGLLLIALGAAKPQNVGACVLQPDTGQVFGTVAFATSSSGAATLSFGLPRLHTLAGHRITAQAAVFVPGEAWLGVAQASNGLGLVLGYPR